MIFLVNVEALTLSEQQMHDVWWVTLSGHVQSINSLQGLLCKFSAILYAELYDIYIAIEGR